MFLRAGLAFVAGLIILPLIGWCYFRFGYAPVATASSPMPFEKRLAKIALNQRIRNEAPKNSPVQPNDANYEAGAHVYRENCAVCQGLPGQPPTPTSKGMYPRPPELFKGHGVTDDPVGETYWKVANGIRLTGMPAYTNSLTETEMWQVSLLLANADKVPQQVRSGLQQPLTSN
jgi:mono/diheme cytochrome c family protein